MKKLEIALNHHPEDKEKLSSTAREIILRAYELNPPGSWRADDSVPGDCHSVIAGLLSLIGHVGQMEGWMVTQAVIPGTQGWHSWLEYDGWVVDFGSGT